jgi:hypothetical protein
MAQGENFGWGDQWSDAYRPKVTQNLNQISKLQPQQYYPGQTYAGMNPQMWNSVENMYNWGQPGGMGEGIARTNTTAGWLNTAGGLQGLDYLNQLKTNGPQTYKYDQGTFNQVMGNLTPGLQGAFDASMRDPIRQYSEQIIPGINQGAAASGQAFGTRPQNQSAIAARGLADRSADTASALWTNAANEANRAGYGAGTQNLAAGINTQQDIIGGYNNYGQLGAQQLNQGYNMGTGNLGQAYTAGQVRQGYDQTMIDADKARFDFNQTAPRQNLMDIYNANMGSRLRGEAGYSGTSSAQGAIQGGQAAMGFLDWYQNRPQSGQVGSPNTVNNGGWQSDPNDPYGWNS